MYYPKNKIKTGFYTSGNEYKVKKNNKNYVGKYFTTFDGKVFSGDVPSSTSVELVATLKDTGEILPINSAIYRIIKSDFIVKKSEYDSFYPILTERDYEIGFFTRYFVKRANGDESTIREIDKKDFEGLKGNVLYKTMSLRWKLVGYLHDYIKDPYNPDYGVYDTNRRTVLLKEIQFSGILRFLRNYIEFARILPLPIEMIIEQSLGLASILDGGELPPIPVNVFPDIYIGVNITGVLPTESEILSGTRINANPAEDIPADWRTMTSFQPLYSWFWIPYGAPGNIKNMWAGTVTLNQGTIGNANDQWESLTPIIVDGVSGYVAISAYRTTYHEIINLKYI